MPRKIGSGVSCGRSGLGRRIGKFKAEFTNVSWEEIGRRFGVSPDHARVLHRISEEIPSRVVDSIGTFKCKAILDGKVPKNHRNPFYRIAAMTEERDLRNLIRKLYGNPKFRDQIDEFGCIACGKAIAFERLRTMQRGKCDGETARPKPSITVRFKATGTLCLA